MIYRFTSLEEDQNVRLDHFLSRKIVDLSRTKLKKMIELGGLHINTKRVFKCGFPLTAGLKIELHTDRENLTPYRISPEDILFEDKYIISINKPAGINCQPTPARYKGTLYEALQVYLKRDRRFGKKLQIGMVQRLDRNTSGVMVFSIHPQAHKDLSAQFQQRQVKKTYIGLINNALKPPQGTLHSFLARRRKDNKIKSVSKGGKEAITKYRILSTTDGITTVEIDLITGRMHQIRAHFSEAGAPLVGDTFYGGIADINRRHFSRHCLHASKLEITHPVSDTPIVFEAPLPNDMII